MITAIVRTQRGYNSDGDKKHVDIYGIRCLSTDNKPSVTNGLTCIEIDTRESVFV